MVKKAATLLFFCIGLWANAQDDELFKNGCEAYNDGRYEKAIGDFLQILDNGRHSAELYYNLGNAYYKLNQVAPSIYYYEKALLLKPGDKETMNNLGYARNMALDAIEPLPETALSKIYNRLTGMLSFDQWGYLAVVLMLLFVAFFIAFYYLDYAPRKRLALVLGGFFLVLALVSVAMAYLRYGDFKADRPAIVFADELTVRSEPNDRSQSAFELHAGTKVQLLDRLNDWQEIRIADGQVGWVPMDGVRPLKEE